MNNITTLEELDAVLEKYLKIENIRTIKEKSGSESFRTRKFSIDGQEYRLTWYINSWTIRIGNAECICDGLTVNGCWPNNYKTNMNFTLDGKTVFVIPIEQYEKQCDHSDQSIIMTIKSQNKKILKLRDWLYNHPRIDYDIKQGINRVLTDVCVRIEEHEQQRDMQISHISKLLESCIDNEEK